MEPIWDLMRLTEKPEMQCCSFLKPWQWNDGVQGKRCTYCEQSLDKSYNKHQAVWQKTTDSPLTGARVGPGRFWELAAPDWVRVSPDTVRLKSLNPLRDKSPPHKGWWDRVRGRKCLQRQDVMFKRIWLRSMCADDDDRGDEEGGRSEELAGSEVLVSEVLALELRSGELGSDAVSGWGFRLESRLWQMLSSKSVCALSNKTLKHQQRKNSQNKI